MPTADQLAHRLCRDCRQQRYKNSEGGRVAQRLKARAYGNRSNGVEQAQLTDAVRSCRLPSLNTPVAMNVRVVPVAMVGFAGATIMVDKVALVTVSSVEPLTDPADAAIVA